MHTCVCVYICLHQTLKHAIMQMGHETTLSDLDATRERPQLLESEKEYLRVELMRQQNEIYVSAHPRTHTHVGIISPSPTRLICESQQFFNGMNRTMCRGNAG